MMIFTKTAIAGGGALPPWERGSYLHHCEVQHPEPSSGD